MAGNGGYPNELLRIVLLTALLFLPAISEHLGWMRLFLPLPLLYYFVTLGEKKSNALVAKAMLAAGAGCLVSGAFPGLLLSLSLLPVGYVLAAAVRRGRSVASAGAMGSATLAIVWVVGASLYGAISPAHPFRLILEAIDVSLLETFKAYQLSLNDNPETLAQLETAIARIRTLVPALFPAFFAVTVLCTVFVNMVLGDLLLKRHTGNPSPWPPFAQWRLPDQLVWLVIISGIGLLVPEPAVNAICLNGVLVAATLYFFQGLAVLSSLFVRWSVPRAFRLFVYALILIQAYGILFLVIAGLIDVWFDLRKTRNETTST